MNVFVEHIIDICKSFVPPFSKQSFYFLKIAINGNHPCDHSILISIWSPSFSNITNISMTSTQPWFPVAPDAPPSWLRSLVVFAETPEKHALPAHTEGGGGGGGTGGRRRCSGSMCIIVAAPAADLCLQTGAVGMSGVDAGVTLEAEVLMTGRAPGVVPQMETADKTASKR